MPRRIHRAWFALPMILLAALTAQGATGNAAFIGGSYTITANPSSSTAVMQVAGIKNTTQSTVSGSLGFELWYSRTSYVGGSISGYKVAASYLPIGNCASSQLMPGASCTGITVTETLTLPPSGTYYPVLLLVEHASTCTVSQGYCIDDYVALLNVTTGGPTVTVGTGSGGGGGSGKTVQFIPGSVSASAIDWTNKTVSISAAGVINTASTATSGSVAIQLWLSSAPYASGAISGGYKVASFPLPVSCTTGSSQLAPGTSCTSITSGTLAVTSPPPGTYYATVVLTEFSPSCTTNGGYCINEGMPLQSQVVVPAPVGGGNAGLGGVRFSQGPLSVSAMDWNNDTVAINVAGVTNTSTTGTSGSLALQLWFLDSPYTGGSISGGYKVASFALPASCTTGNAQLAPLAGCSSISSGTIAATRPPSGVYFAAVVLAEYDSSSCTSNGGYCIAQGVALQGTQTVPAPLLIGGGVLPAAGGGGAMDTVIAVFAMLVAVSGWHARRRTAAKVVSE